MDGKAIEGKAMAITVLTPIKPARTPLLRLVFFVGAHVSVLNKKLVQLSFIHYARWVIITHIPYNGPPQRREPLTYDYLFFESNFNGTWNEYIDAFSEVVPDRMTAIWGSSYGFPGPKPVGPFKDYIRHNDLDIAHFYAAYPDATTTEVLASLELVSHFARFQKDAEGLDAETFSAEWKRFITENQHLL